MDQAHRQSHLQPRCGKRMGTGPRDGRPNHQAGRVVSDVLHWIPRHRSRADRRCAMKGRDHGLATAPCQSDHPSRRGQVGPRCLLQALRDLRRTEVAPLVQRSARVTGTDRRRHSRGRRSGLQVKNPACRQRDLAIVLFNKASRMVPRPSSSANPIPAVGLIRRIPRWFMAASLFSHATLAACGETLRS